MLASHALHEHFRVLVDENVWLRFLSVRSSEHGVNHLVSLWIAHVSFVGCSEPNRS